MPEQKISLTKLYISNIMGLQEVELELGKFNEIRGRNGSGKTSIIESVKGALKGGTDATLLRQGEAEAEIVLILDDGTTITKTIKEKNTKLEVFNGRDKVTKPQSYIDALYDILSVNPVAFLTATKKDRAKVLLDVLPLELPADKIDAVLKDVNLLIPKSGSDHPLAVIQSAVDAVFNERTGVNRALKEKEAAINQLKESLVEIDFDADSLAANITQLEADISSQVQKKEAYTAKLNTDKAAELEALRLKYEEDKASVDDKYKKTFSAMQEKYDEKYNARNVELAGLRQKIKTAGGVQKSKELVEQYKSELSALTVQTAKLSKAIENLNSIKLGMLENLPIPGLEVRDGEIYKGGVIFDRLNTAQQVQIAIEVAKLKAGSLKLICVDGLECLDSEAYEEFKKSAIESGLQLIVTKVTDTDLEFTKSDTAEPEAAEVDYESEVPNA